MELKDLTPEQKANCQFDAMIEAVNAARKRTKIPVITDEDLVVIRAIWDQREENQA